MYKLFPVGLYVAGALNEFIAGIYAHGAIVDNISTTSDIGLAAGIGAAGALFIYWVQDGSAARRN